VSADLIALAAGTALAVCALGFVLYPLFFSIGNRSARTTRSGVDTEDSPIVALREIEFDRATGKLSEADYAELRKTYADRALRDLRGASVAAREAAAPEAADAIEARVRAYRLSHRECPTCGLRPEPDANYCSTCGGYLDRVCPQCTAEITESSAAFCSRCGATIAQRHARVFA